MAATAFEDIVRRLSIADTESKQKLDAASSLRDSLDHYTNGPLYPTFLKKTMPPFVNILRGACVFQTTSVEQVGCRLPYA